MLKVRIKKNCPEAILPVYQTEGSSGLDLFAALEKGITLEPFERRLISTGISVEIPRGYEAQVRSRSGLAVKHGIIVLNSPGTIDSDYRGEIKIVLINISNNSFIVEPGMRIAQLVFSSVIKINWEVSEDLEETVRNKGGFGHTGTF